MSYLRRSARSQGQGAKGMASQKGEGIMAFEIYRHYDKDGALLYVGSSHCTIARLATHRSSSPWFDAVTRIEIERKSSYEEMLNGENFAIRMERPKFNIFIPTEPKPRSTSGRGRPRLDEVGKPKPPTAWAIAGMSRRTWYRRQKEMKA